MQWELCARWTLPSVLWKAGGQSASSRSNWQSLVLKMKWRLWSQAHRRISLHLIHLISLDCSCQKFSASGNMIFSLLNSDGKKAMIGCVLSSLFANSLFGKQFLSVAHRLVQRELKCSGVACLQCTMGQWWTCSAPKELTLKAGTWKLIGHGSCSATMPSSGKHFQVVSFPNKNLLFICSALKLQDCWKAKPPLLRDF